MQSMGGLITMLMYFQSDPDMWSDLILASPHLIISDVMIPSKVLRCKVHDLKSSPVCFHDPGRYMLFVKIGLNRLFSRQLHDSGPCRKREHIDTGYIYCMYICKMMENKP
ncbi:hypothetical protein L2E82_06280 [Cichorium intybus]|uniref:Uncharacterized protein n=1 Tax=Cichorium intybus TaxID=13427 RepID=A0ACB9HAC8_CICIN|nr:hypothetical protein L2E82_06280 [Cichorium intybus]